MLILALGIGATTSIFTLVYAVMLKSLAVAKPSELVRVGKSASCCYQGGYSQNPEFSLVSHELYEYLRDHTQGFSELAAFSASDTGLGVRRAGKPEPAQSDVGEIVTGNYFKMFGVRAYAGRTLLASDERPGAPAVAVMSYRLWAERYGSDPSIVGTVFEFNNKPVTVVGVAPPDFFGDTLRPSPPDFFLPIDPEDADVKAPDLAWFEVIGRLKPGYSAARVQAEMRVELKQWLRSHWGEMSANDRALFPQQTLNLAPGGAGITAMRDEYEHWLRILMMASGFLLLIICANVANLMLVRGIERRRQISVSIALGARPWSLVRQALTESVLLSFAGAAAGLAVAFGGTSFILRFVFPRLGEMGEVPIQASPSIAVLMFVFALSLATGIAFGIAPAWMATRVNPIEALRGAGRSTAQRDSLPRKALVVLQAALALVLLCASGLLTSALAKLEHQDFGFEQNDRIVVRFDPRLAGYAPSQLAPLYGRIEDVFARIPGVSQAALCNYSPLSGNNWGSGVWVNGRAAPGPHDDVDASFDRVRGGYFAAIGNPILRGRAIADRDTAMSEHVAVVNEAFARKFFKGEDPIGKYFRRAELPGVAPYKIVGVAKDARYLTSHLDQPPAPFFFLPETQHDVVMPSGHEIDPGSHYMQNLVILTRSGSNLSYNELRRALASVDPALPITAIQPFKQQVDAVFRQQTLIARLTSFFGFLSLVLSSIGLYGVTAYNAERRTNEIGIRIALGAKPAHALSLILRGAFSLIVFGLALGLPLAIEAGHLLGAELYGLSPYNAPVTAFAAVVLGLCGFAACLIPALKASAISPAQALRNE